MAIEEDDLSLPEGNEIIETNDIHEEEVEVNNIFYEISFKCNTDIFKSKLIYNVGEMVIVHCERGYNVGFVIREVPQYEIHDRAERTHFKPKKIHSRVTENIDNVRDMLKSKIEVENFALTQCRAHMRGHRLGAFAEALATEFQFDHKKLIVYLKKYEEVSVCRLVRKLYDKFKTRIKVIEVESLEELHKKSMIYIEISKLDITLSHIFEAIQEENSSKYLLSKYQQLNSSTIYSTQVTATGDENSAANIFYEYQNYRPSNRVKTQLLMNQKNNTDQLALYNDAIDYGLGKSFLHNPPSPPEIDITFDDNNTQFINYNQMYDSITSKKNYNHSTYQPPLTNNIPLVPSSSSSTTTKTKSISPLSFHNNHNNNNNNYTNHHNNHQQSYNNNNNNNRYKSSIPLRQNYTSSSQYYNHQQQHTTNKYHQNNHYEQSYHDYIDNDINPHFRVTQVDEFERQYSYPHYVIEHK